jgi:hypothetical protein
VFVVCFLIAVLNLLAAGVMLAQVRQHGLILRESCHI